MIANNLVINYFREYTLNLSMLSSFCYFLDVIILKALELPIGDLRLGPRKGF